MISLSVHNCGSSSLELPAQQSVGWTTVLLVSAFLGHLPLTFSYSPALCEYSYSCLFIHFLTYFLRMNSESEDGWDKVCSLVFKVSHCSCRKGATPLFRKESSLPGPGLECSFTPNLPASQSHCRNPRGPQTGLHDGVQRQDSPGWACAWPWPQGFGARTEKQ